MFLSGDIEEKMSRVSSGIGETSRRCETCSELIQFVKSWNQFWWQNLEILGWNMRFFRFLIKPNLKNSKRQKYLIFIICAIILFYLMRFSSPCIHHSFGFEAKNSLCHCTIAAMFWNVRPDRKCSIDLKGWKSDGAKSGL